MRFHALFAMDAVDVAVILHNIATLFNDDLDGFEEVQEEPEEENPQDHHPDNAVRLVGQLARDDLHRQFCYREDLL